MNRILVLKNNRTLLSAFGREISCTCLVRNELSNGALRRGVDQVVLTEPSPGFPYMPRQFPIGTWNVRKPQVETDDPKAYIQYWWIGTDAEQEVEVWTTREVEDHEEYVAPSGRTVMDKGYGIHCSASATTLGCLRIDGRKDLEFLALKIIDALSSGDTIQVEVIA